MFTILQYGYGIAFDEAGFWSFCNDLTKNIVIFSVENIWQ